MKVEINSWELKLLEEHKVSSTIIIQLFKECGTYSKHIRQYLFRNGCL